MNYESSALWPSPPIQFNIWTRPLYRFDPGYVSLPIGAFKLGWPLITLFNLSQIPDPGEFSPTSPAIESVTAASAVACSTVGAPPVPALILLDNTILLH